MAAPSGAKATAIAPFDMHGNVWEWCNDEQRQPDGALHRLLRSGRWNNGSGHCRAGYR